MSLAMILAALLAGSVCAQDISYERDRHRSMLTVIVEDVKKNYFDPHLKGIDIDAKFKAADEKIKQATTIGQMSGIVAQFLLDFDDSHLFFLPPGKQNHVDYGFEMRLIGDKCFVVKLDPKSDATAKGLAVGDQITSIEGVAPSRAIFWKMEYYYYALRPRLRLKLTGFKPDGKPFEIEPAARITPGKAVLDATDSDYDKIVRDGEDDYYKSVNNIFMSRYRGFLYGRCRVLALSRQRSTI
jgi:hypothetical protein